MTSATQAQICNQRFSLHYSRKACFLGAVSEKRLSIRSSGMETLAEQHRNKSLFPPQLSFCSALRGRAGRTDLLICKEPRPQLSGAPSLSQVNQGLCSLSFSPQLIFFFPISICKKIHNFSSLRRCHEKAGVEPKDEGLHQCGDISSLLLAHSAVGP